MESFTVIPVLLLCSLNWISVSGSESQIMEVQPGEEVTLTCTNISSGPAQTEWFRLIHGTKPSCISSMYRADDEASLCDGFQNRFKMSSNINTVFLKIKQVNLSDCGLYFCGFYINKHTVIAKATQLNIQGNGESDGGVDSKSEKDSDEKTNLINVILGSLTILLTIVVIFLAVKNWKLQKAVSEEQQPQRNTVNPPLTDINCDVGSDELNYAALNFQGKPKRSSRPPPKREMEPHVVYAATR
ncbi:uncharacterized protein LOC121962271 [Plectropomus leopardus]|uniref:uncharacterized protein LOC121962271 n=1 Tax=Plectropomus leopardus TaxID=160734 RepID=UPI001C4AEF13|nr:uncharacterized protein LOC121962271 [Plectropomus leopardus]